MIKKTVILTILISILYALVIQIGGFEGITSFNVWKRNVARAEEFVFSEINPEIIVVGSSASANLINDSISDQLYNLSTEGGNCISGIKLVNKSKKYPEILIVEFNSLFRIEDFSIDDEVFQKGIFTLKEFNPSMRIKHRPIAYASNFLQRIKEKVEYELNINNQVFYQEKRNENNDEARSVLMKNNVEFFNHLDDKEIINIQFKLIEKELAELKNKGVKIILIEIPSELEIYQSLKAKYIREIALEIANNNSFEIYVQTDNMPNRTTDGSHLDYQSSLIYSNYLKEIIKKSN